MARPQAADYDARKAKILATSAQVFAETGFHKASVSQVARACDMSKSLIYHYYTSKQDLLFHAMQSHVHKLADLAENVTKEKLEPKEKLRTLVHDYLKVYETTSAEHHLLVNELSSLSPEQQSTIIDVQNKVVHIFADLAEEIAEKPMDQDNIKSVVSMLMLGMINWTYIWFKPNGPVNSDMLADLITDIFLGGIPELSKANDL